MGRKNLTQSINGKSSARAPLFWPPCSNSSMFGVELLLMCVVDSRETGAAESVAIAAERSQPRRRSDGARSRDQLRH